MKVRSAVSFALGLPLLLLVAGLTASCAKLPAGDPVPEDVVARQAAMGQRLLPGDEIEVKFLYAPELNTKQVIRRDGMIALALVETVQAEGLTPEELEERLEKSYAPYVKDPAITVVVVVSRQRVLVGGEVEKPGEVPMPGRMTALEAVMAAGGFKRLTADIGGVLVLREENGRRTSRTVDLGEAQAESVSLQPGDVIYVPAR